MQTGSEGIPTRTAAAKASGWLLLGLYGAGVIVANPVFAFGLFYVVFLVWVLFAVFAKPAVGTSDRWILHSLWILLAVWIGSVIPALFFATLVEMILWFVGAIGTIVLGSILLSRSLRSGGGGVRSRRLADGRDAGIVAALMTLFPFYVGWVAGPVTPIPGSLGTFVLVILVPFLPEIVAIASFGLALRASRVT